MVERLRSLTVEPAYASLTVEPAYASLSVEPPKGSLTVEHLSSPLPYGRAPLLISRACLRTLKVQFTSFLLTLEDA
jgi:hypothetical protein